MATADILVISYQRPGYLRRSLTRLLDSCDDAARVWLWHNGGHAETLEVAHHFARDERVARFHHSPENQKLTAPTNWLWENSTAAYVSKVDDDCLVTPGWIETLRAAHDDNDRIGVVGSWRFPDEDFDPMLAGPKIKEFGGGHRLLVNFWVQGSGYLMKRECISRHGVLRQGESFTEYCIRLALSGWTNGWYYPFIREEHMDDPRSPFTDLKSDGDLQRDLPLSAQLRGITTLAAWEERMRASAREVQAASIDPRDYRGLRSRVKRARQALRR